MSTEISKPAGAPAEVETSKPELVIETPKTPEQLAAEAKAKAEAQTAATAAKKAELETQRDTLVANLDSIVTALEGMAKARTAIPTDFAAMPDKLTAQIAAINVKIDELGIYDNLKKVQAVFAEAANQLQHLNLHSELTVTVKLGRDKESGKLTVIEVTPVGKRASTTPKAAASGDSTNAVGKGRTVNVEGVEYPSAAEACRTLNVEIGTNSAVRALTAAAKKNTWTINFAE